MPSRPALPAAIPSHTGKLLTLKLRNHEVSSSRGMPNTLPTRQPDLMVKKPIDLTPSILSGLVNGVPEFYALGVTASGVIVSPHSPVPRMNPVPSTCPKLIVASSSARPNPVNMAGISIGSFGPTPRFLIAVVADRDRKQVTGDHH